MPPATKREPGRPKESSNGAATRKKKYKEEVRRLYIAQLCTSVEFDLLCVVIGDMLPQGILTSFQICWLSNCKNQRFSSSPKLLLHSSSRVFPPTPSLGVRYTVQRGRSVSFVIMGASNAPTTRWNWDQGRVRIASTPTC